MKINVLHMIDGAKKATGTTVIIDVFRAFTVEAYCFSMGAIKIIPVGDAKIAYELKEKNPEYILVGERHGKILPGFDCGNSPSEIVKLDLKGKTIILGVSGSIAAYKIADLASKLSKLFALACEKFLSFFLTNFFLPFCYFLNHILY